MVYSSADTTGFTRAFMGVTGGMLANEHNSVYFPANGNFYYDNMYIKTDREANPVPEPDVIMLLFIGLGGMRLLKR